MIVRVCKVATADGAIVVGRGDPRILSGAVSLTPINPITQGAQVRRGNQHLLTAAVGSADPSVVNLGGVHDKPALIVARGEAQL